MPPRRFKRNLLRGYGKACVQSYRRILKDEELTQDNLWICSAKYWMDCYTRDCMDWEDQQGNNYHQQQNRRQEAAKVYVAAPTNGRGYAGNLPWYNRCKAHHQPGLCPPRCGKCHKLGHQEGECRTRIPVAGGNLIQMYMLCCGNLWALHDDCPD
ncbi:hypothetical protein Tco_0280916 [Tanacetum coccineum]